MANSHHHAEQHGEQQSARAVVKIETCDGKYDHCGKRDSARPTMNPLAENRINRVPAIELSRRNQVEARDQKSEPRRVVKRVRIDRNFQVNPEKAGKELKKQRVGKNNLPAFGWWDGRG